LGQGLTPDEALQTVSNTGKPLLAIATSPTCGPCLALKSVIHSDPALRPLLSQFVYLEMDRRSSQFAEFQAKFPAEMSGVPMVYLIRPDGEIMYGQSGGMGAEQLTLLMNHGIANSGRIFSPSELQRLEAVYAKARQRAEDGDLAEALSVISRIAEVDSFAEVVYRAGETRDRLHVLISNWIQQLDRSIAAGKSVHANLYRLAELHVELPESASILRSHTRNLLQLYETEEQTRTAMLQNKRLVRARLEEERDLRDAALASYRYVVQLAPTSPAGQFAKDRMRVVAQRQQTKLTSVSSGGAGTVVAP
jgi:hypothetical protein